VLWLIPLLFVETEAIGETVRLGHDRTTLTHLVLAVLVLEEQMAARDLHPAPEYKLSCDFVLRKFAVDRESVSLTLSATGEEGAIAPPQRRRAWRSNPKNPPWTVAAARAAERARDVARSGNGASAGSAHLLYAVLSDPDDSGRRLLQDQSVDPAAVQDLLTARLGISAPGVLGGGAEATGR
jgi:hypothetical protein